MSDHKAKALLHGAQDVLCDARSDVLKPHVEASEIVDRSLRDFLLVIAKVMSRLSRGIRLRFLQAVSYGRLGQELHLKAEICLQAIHFGAQLPLLMVQRFVVIFTVSVR